MKKTAVLQVVYSQHIERNLLIMHPNDGFELGMMTKTHPVELSTKVDVRSFLTGQHGSTFPVRIDLLNECPHLQLQMNIAHGKDIGMPEKAVLFYNGKHIYVHAVPVPPKT